MQYPCELACHFELHPHPHSPFLITRVQRTQKYFCVTFKKTIFSNKNQVFALIKKRGGYCICEQSVDKSYFSALLWEE